MHYQRTLFIKSAIALIQQNDPQLQTQLEIKSSVSHAEKDHRISCKKEFFSSPPLPLVPIFFPKTLYPHSYWSSFFSFLKKYVPLLLCNGLATMHTNTCWLDILVCHIMVILLGFLFKTTTTGSYFRAKELCRYRLRQDIPSSPKTSTVPARAIPRSPAMRAKWRGPLFKACKMPS